MKYYVSSGEFEEVVMASDPTEASIAFLKRIDEREGEDALFGLVIHISEVGFDLEGDDESSKRHDDDLFVLTTSIMEKAGWDVEDFQDEE